MPAAVPRLVQDRWCDVRGTPVGLFSWVEQIQPSLRSCALLRHRPSIPHAPVISPLRRVALPCAVCPSLVHMSQVLCDASPMSAKASIRSQTYRSGWTSAAQLGQAHWFFGNLYEGLVGMPELLADAQPLRAPRLLGPGSPIRYYVPAAPLTIAATTVALIDSWRSGGDKRAIIMAGASLATATGLTAHLIRRVNLRLLGCDEPLNASEQRRLVRVWHRTNVVRLIALAIAALSLRQAARPYGDA